MKKLRLPPLLLALALTAGAPPAAGAAELSYGDYHEQRASVQNAQGKWGFVDAEGERVVPCVYDRVTAFHCGAAFVEKDGKVGVIGPGGEELAPCEYDRMSPFQSGLSIAQRDGQYAAISRTPVCTSQSYEGKQLTGVTTTHVFRALSDNKLTVSNGLLLVHYDNMYTGDGQAVPYEAKPGFKDYDILSGMLAVDESRRADFTDVDGTAWYDKWVNLAYAAGLMNGKPEDRFDPLGTLTVAEAVVVAHNIHEKSNNILVLDRPASSPWYQYAVDDLTADGILTAHTFDSYDRPITRGEMACLFSHTCLGRLMPQAGYLRVYEGAGTDHVLEDYAVKDVEKDVTPYAEEILKLQGQGILTGDENGLFHPQAGITRAEVSTIVARMALTEERIVPKTGLPLSATPVKLYEVEKKFTHDWYAAVSASPSGQPFDGLK